LSRIRIFMRDVVIPYNTMSYEIVKPPSKPWLESLTYVMGGPLLTPSARFASRGAAEVHSLAASAPGKVESRGNDQLYWPEPQRGRHDEMTAAGRSPGRDQRPPVMVLLPPPSAARRHRWSGRVGSGFLALTPPGYELAPCSELEAALLQGILFSRRFSYPCPFVFICGQSSPRLPHLVIFIPSQQKNPSGWALGPAPGGSHESWSSGLSGSAQARSA